MVFCKDETFRILHSRKMRGRESACGRRGVTLSTIKDVARRAGVAISTVSAVLNRSAPVSEETVTKVQQAVADIGYVPHGAARSLRSGQSRLIGLVVPNIANP